MPQNETLIKYRKAKQLHQKDLGIELSRALGKHTTPSYAQRKVSLWESLQAKPSSTEIEHLARILDCDLATLRDSFSGPPLPVDPSSLIEALRSTSPSPALIATCAGSQTRARLLDEVEGSLIPALQDNVSIAIFFPYPLRVEGATESSAIVGVAGLYMHAWTTVLNFYNGLRARLNEASEDRLALYLPKRTIDVPANILVPPMLRRSTLTFQFAGKELRRALYVWTQSDKRDRFYEMEVTSPDIFDQQNLEMQINAWQWYFGDIVTDWSASNKLSSNDAYWIRFNK